MTKLTRSEAEVRAQNIRANARALSTVTLDKLESLTELEVATLDRLLATLAFKSGVAPGVSTSAAHVVPGTATGGWALHVRHTADKHDPAGLAYLDEALAITRERYPQGAASWHNKVATLAARYHAANPVVNLANQVAIASGETPGFAGYTGAEVYA